MSDGNQPADLPLPERPKRDTTSPGDWIDLGKRISGFDAWLHIAPPGALDMLRAQGAAAERAAIQAHLRGVVADRARQGNDYVLGALLDAIRELVAAMPTTDDLLAGDAP